MSNGSGSDLKMSGLVWVKTICKGYKQMALELKVGKPCEGVKKAFS